MSEFFEAGKRVAAGNGWKKNKKLSEKYKRDVYNDADGMIFSLDTRHGEFEVLDSKGKHQGAIDFEGKKIKDADKTGKHDYKVK